MLSGGGGKLFSVLDFWILVGFKMDMVFMAWCTSLVVLGNVKAKAGIGISGLS